MDLIIQGQNIDSADLNKLATLSATDCMEPITKQAFRLINPKRKKGVAEFCTQSNLDHAFVSHDMSLKNFGLVVIDMDSTLIAIECIDEIADMCHVKNQVADITHRAMHGEIDFTESLKQRTALLQGLPVSALQKVYDERLSFNPGAHLMIKKMSEAGLKTMIISGGFTFFTDKIKNELAMDFTVANTLEIKNDTLTGKITGKIIDAQGKAEALKRVRHDLGLNKNQVIAIGDGANDLQMLAEASVSIAYHAKPIVQEHATYTINYVGLDGIINLFA